MSCQPVSGDLLGVCPAVRQGDHPGAVRLCRDPGGRRGDKRPLVWKGQHRRVLRHRYSAASLCGHAGEVGICPYRPMCRGADDGDDPICPLLPEHPMELHVPEQEPGRRVAAAVHAGHVGGGDRLLLAPPGRGDDRQRPADHAPEHRAGRPADHGAVRPEELQRGLILRDPVRCQRDPVPAAPGDRRESDGHRPDGVGAVPAGQAHRRRRAGAICLSAQERGGPQAFAGGKRLPLHDSHPDHQHPALRHHERLFRSDADAVRPLSGRQCPWYGYLLRAISHPGDEPHESRFASVYDLPSDRACDHGRQPSRAAVHAQKGREGGGVNGNTHMFSALGILRRQGPVGFS